MNGVYKEVTKLFGTSVECYILACRSKQGYDEWKQSSKEECDLVLQRWYSLGVELESKAVRTPFAREWESATRVLMHAKERSKTPLKEHLKEHLKGHRIRHRHSVSEGAEIDKITPGNFQEAMRRASHLLSDLVRLYRRDELHPRHHQKDPTLEGIARVRSDKSAEDLMFERVLQSSLDEMRTAHESGDSENAYNRAIEAGVEAARKSSLESASAPGKRRSSQPPAPLSREEVKENAKDEYAKRDSDDAEAARLHGQGVDDVTEYVIWKTLTDQRQSSDENAGQGSKLNYRA